MTRDWIALDWTTTYRRVWVMRGRDLLDEIIDTGPRPADAASILELVAARHDGQGVPVVACGPLGPVRDTVPCTPALGWALADRSRRPARCAACGAGSGPGRTGRHDAGR